MSGCRYGLVAAMGTTECGEGIEAAIVDDGIHGSLSCGVSTLGGRCSTGTGEDEGTEAQQQQQQVVVGQCIDCDAPHDRFSGRIVCSVCR